MGHHNNRNENRIHRLEWQDVTVEDFPTQDYILDIGGGGEGIIGRLKGEKAIAIDKSKQELSETPDGHLKIVMDARDLNFLDNSFSTVTAFFSMMYIPQDDHERVFNEIFRVLKPNGRFYLWDAILPKRMENKKDIAMFPLNIKLPYETIKTGYGAAWPKEGRTVDYYINLIGNIDFEIEDKKVKNKTFFIRLRKR
jgi:ubiquinone/menaquinone biosynthesis C-methylase UbiE